MILPHISRWRYGNKALKQLLETHQLQHQSRKKQKRKLEAALVDTITPLCLQYRADVEKDNKQQIAARRYMYLFTSKNLLYACTIEELPASRRNPLQRLWDWYWNREHCYFSVVIIKWNSNPDDV